jgi:AraC-like DNA-binding protein
VTQRNPNLGRPYILSGYLRGLFVYLRARNAPVEPVLSVLGLTEEELRDPDRRIDPEVQTELFQVAERVTGDMNVGLHAGEMTHVMHFGLIGLLAMTCTTVRELVELHSRFQGLITTGATVHYAQHGDHLVGDVAFMGTPPRLRHSIEYNTTSHLTVARLMAGFAFSPAKMEVPYPEPADTSEQQRVFGCPVEYGSDHLRYYFPAFLLGASLVTSDSGPRPALELEARRRLDALTTPVSDESAEITHLKQVIAAGLREGPPSVEDAAAALGLSTRKLQRHLEVRGLTYREILDSTRREMAERCMADETLSQTDVAYVLGFADQSALHRAFRRWFEMTPGEYRAARRRS